MPGWIQNDILQAVQKAEEQYQKFTTPYDSQVPSEYENAPRQIQELLDTCFCFIRVLTDFNSIVTRFVDVYPQPNDFSGTINDCEKLFSFYWNLKNTSFLPSIDLETSSSGPLLRSAWQGHWSIYGRDCSDLVNKLRVEIRKFNIYLLLGALSRKDPESSSTELRLASTGYDPTPIHHRMATWHLNMPGTVLEDPVDEIPPLDRSFDELYNELASIRYMYKRETNINTLRPGRVPYNFSSLEHKLLKLWQVLCIRAGIAQIDGPVPPLPRDSVDLLNFPERNLSEMTVSISHHSIHWTFRPPAYVQEHIEAPLPDLPPVTTMPWLSSSQYATSAADDDEFSSPRPLHHTSSSPSHDELRWPEPTMPAQDLYSRHGPPTPDLHNRPSSQWSRPSSYQSPIPHFNAPSPFDSRDRTGSFHSTPYTSPYPAGLQATSHPGSISLGASDYSIATITLTSRLQPLRLVKFSIEHINNSLRCVVWEVAHSNEKLRHYWIVPARGYVVPHVPPDSMSNSLTVRFYQRHMIEYMEPDYNFQQEISVRYTFGEIATRDNFQEAIRGKRLIDSFGFDLLWTDVHPRESNYGMPTGLTQSERLNIWVDSAYPYRHTISFFHAEHHIEIALRDIRELPHEDKHHHLSIDLGSRETFASSPLEASSSRFKNALRRRSSASKDHSTLPLPTLTSLGSTDPDGILEGVRTLYVQFAPRPSPQPSTSAFRGRRPSASSRMSSGERIKLPQESTRFIEVFRTVWQDDLRDPGVPNPREGVVEAPDFTFAPSELPAVERRLEMEGDNRPLVERQVDRQGTLRRLGFGRR
ncbi:hypothetical protein BT63DRAFT_414611 [Microthyrium microscopicum]|uniref:Uncharacterized protein n=1 Tax=Microthyrium microscopicum TaxID=703497 RepID=A0A6A6UAK9_9PEZI|nr:hypothetical protein BT63DRAFT_414611 [Microthyrium microscopicum]